MGTGMDGTYDSCRCGTSTGCFHVATVREVFFVVTSLEDEVSACSQYLESSIYVADGLQYIVEMTSPCTNTIEDF